MASNPRSTVSEPGSPTLVVPLRRMKSRRTRSLKPRLLSTVLALGLLVLVLRFLPPEHRNAQANVAQQSAAPVTPNDLKLSDVQMSQSPDGQALYLDGLITNQGQSKVLGATAEVRFQDAGGSVVASVEKPLVGMAHGGTDLVRNEFAKNPITPGEMRFFRVAVEPIPPSWNHEVPGLKLIAVKTP